MPIWVNNYTTFGIQLEKILIKFPLKKHKNVKNVEKIFHTNKIAFSIMGLGQNHSDQIQKNCS